MPAFTTNVEFGYWLKKCRKNKIFGLDIQEELKLEPLSNLYDLMQKSIDF